MRNVCKITFCLSMLISVIYGSIDISSIFGSNIDSEAAWKKLMELENCPTPTTTEGMIIMVNESIAAGAEYISNPEATSRYECEFNCCNDDNKCNVAIFASQQKHCYLFNCGSPSKCAFDSHQGYSISILKDVEKPQPKTTLPSQLFPTSTQSPKQVSLMGGCRTDIDSCSDLKTECRDGFCLCVDGFHPKNGACRKDCLAGLEFECINGNKTYGQPDCIAIYDYCDGVAQCPDGSDERNCQQENMNHEQSLAELGKHNSSATKLSASHTSLHDPADDKSAHIGTDGKSDLTAAHASSQPSTENESLTDVDKRLNTDNDTLTDSQEVLIATEPESKNPISPARAHSTAIIALSVALSFTLVIVIYLAIRYHNVRKQLHRRGKPLKGSEVDYLIDGMYL